MTVTRPEIREYYEFPVEDGAAILRGYEWVEVDGQRVTRSADCRSPALFTFKEDYIPGSHEADCFLCVGSIPSEGYRGYMRRLFGVTEADEVDSAVARHP